MCADALEDVAQVFEWVDAQAFASARDARQGIRGARGFGKTIDDPRSGSERGAALGEAKQERVVGGRHEGR